MPLDDSTSQTSPEVPTSSSSLPAAISLAMPSGSNTKPCEESPLLDEDFLTAPLVGLCRPKLVHEMTDAELLDYITYQRQISGSYQTFRAAAEAADSERTGRKTPPKKQVTSNDIDDLLE